MLPCSNRLSLAIIGAYTVMNGTDFTIGMLVAFQMFASRVSQPMLRMVGLWQQFQQANLSVLRLGDIMNAPADGTIKLDGHDIRHLSANELRHYFGVVPQETILFSGTLYENLLMANPHATFDQVVHACRMAEIHEVIEQLPQGYQTEIGERGVGLSGGQKQRLAIARALLKQPKILIFDEATSSLDAQTAEHFAATINQLRGKVTMLFITHALPKGLVVDEVVRIGQESISAVEPEPTHRDAGVIKTERYPN
jgi:ABC-type bacteriocin/lantibiotic exporter with double-glycine peptidase domain